MKRVDRKQAQAAEDFVALALNHRGCRIVGRNFRVKGSELDIIAYKKQSLYVVEVKYRKRPARWAYQLDAMMSWSKRIALKRGCQMFLRRFEWEVKSVRFDLAVVSPLLCKQKKTFGMQYFPNVFESSETS